MHEGGAAGPSAQDLTPQEREGGGGEGVPVAEEVAGAAARSAAAAEAPVAEAEGMRLHLSSSSSTGYKGVYKGDRGNSGRFRAQTYRSGPGGENCHLGFFDTAVEAAVAYARAVMEEAAAEVEETQQREEQREQRPNSNKPNAAEREMQRLASDLLAPALRRRAAAASAAEAEAAAATQPVSEADGLRLHLFDKNATGYKGVRTSDSGRRFEARRKVDGRCVSLGHFDTAVEAAVAYARAVAEAEAEESGGSATGKAGEVVGGPSRARAEKLPIEFSWLSATDRELWYGESAAGWHVSPQGEVFRSRAAAAAAAEEEADETAAAEADEAWDEAGAASAYPRVSGALESVGISLARQAAELSDVAGADLAFLGHMSHAQLRALGEECMALPESARVDFLRELVWRRGQERGGTSAGQEPRAFGGPPPPPPHQLAPHSLQPVGAASGGPHMITGQQQRHWDAQQLQQLQYQLQAQQAHLQCYQFDSSTTQWQRNESRRR